MTESGSSEQELLTCGDCGRRRHIYPWHCPRDLHGEDDPFKTSCAICRTEIPSGGDRAADKYGNLYCDAECKAEGLETLIDEMSGASIGGATVA